VREKERKEERKPENRVTTADELLQKTRKIIETPSGLKLRIRKVTPYTLAQHEACRPMMQKIQRATRRGEENVAALEDPELGSSFIQMVVHLGVIEPALALPGLAATNGRPTVDDLGEELMFVYEAISVFSGIKTGPEVSEGTFRDEGAPSAP